MIGTNNHRHVLYVSTGDQMSYATLGGDKVPTPLCAQITPGVVSLSFSKGVGYTVTGDMFFKRMGAAPFFFLVNADPYYMAPRPGGVCSLKVDWSCYSQEENSEYGPEGVNVVQTLFDG